MNLLNLYIDEITKHLLKDSNKGEVVLSNDIYEKVKNLLNDLRVAMMSLISYSVETNTKSEDTLKVKLPNFTSFDELSKICNDLKLAIELPIYDSNTQGNVIIKSAEPGSIILFITLGTLGGYD